jgi:hypothetical protein
MNGLKLSCVLILLALGLGLNTANLRANGDQIPGRGGEKKTSVRTSPATKKQEAQAEKKQPVPPSIPIQDDKQSKDGKGEPSQANTKKHEETTSEVIARYSLYGTWFQAFILVLTVTVMIFTAIRQLRAYVGIDNIHTDYSEDKTKTTVNIMVKNTGHTPAYDFRCTVRLHWVGDLSAPVPHKVQEVPGSSRSVLFPGGVSRNSTKTDIPQSRLMVQKIPALYMDGSIKYRHAFSLFFTKDRITNFRYIWDTEHQDWRAGQDGHGAT